jgi:DNA-directed RNA polymerase subunit omega
VLDYTVIRTTVKLDESWLIRYPAYIFMQKRLVFDSSEVIYHAQKLLDAATNRYRITVQVANRAKRRRYEDFDSIDDPLMKPAIRAIIEMSDELTQPEIISDN